MGQAIERTWLSGAADEAELALSQWGRWDDEIAPALLLDLQMAYVRRQKFLARMQAVEFVNALSEALSMGAKGAGPGATGKVRVGNSGKRYQEMSIDGMMAQMGVKF